MTSLLFADGDIFNFSHPRPHHKAAAEPKQTQGSWLPDLQLQDFMARCPASPLRTTHWYLHFLPLPQHGGQNQVCCTTGTTLLLLPPLPLALLPELLLTTPSAAHPALCTGHPPIFHGHALPSNPPPSEAAFAKRTSTMLMQPSLCMKGNTEATPGIRWGTPLTSL